MPSMNALASDFQRPDLAGWFALGVKRVPGQATGVAPLGAEGCQTRLKRRHVRSDVTEIGEHSSLDPFRITGRPGANIEIATRLDQLIPDQIAAVLALEVKFISALN